MIDGHVFDPDSGHFLSEKHRRIGEIINDYNPDLHLVWIPPTDRNAEDTMPFAILHTPPGRPEYIVFKVAEDEVDARLLARLWENDMAVNNPLRRLEALEAANQAILYKKQMEEAEERADIARSMFKSPLNVYRFGGKDLRLT